MSQLAAILRRHWAAYAPEGAAHVLPSHRAAVEAILSCHSPQRGGSLYACACGSSHWVYHGCGHRACPQCGGREAQAWIQKQSRRLLPVTYHLVTFTVPEELRLLIRSNQRVLLDILFGASAGAMQDVAKARLGGELGLLGALHTWSRQLVYHPHIHYIVPGLALGKDGSYALPGNPDYLLPVQVLSVRMRARFESELRSRSPALYTQVAKSVWRKGWVVHSEPVGTGEAALKYLARYVHRTALSAERHIEENEDGSISFSYRESATRQMKTAQLGAHEFIARFLQHVLPRRLRRVRAYGWLAPAARRRQEKLRLLLDAAAPAPTAREPVVVRCPRCQAPMRRIATIKPPARGREFRSAARGPPP